jgi:DNA-binding transcriptional ArsR family regulator
MALKKSSRSKIINVLSNETRFLILHWLKEPEANFGSQTVGSFENDGVCVTLIQQKTKLTQSTTSAYLTQLLDVGLVKSKRVGQWTYYKRDEMAIKKFLADFASL